MKAVKVRQYGSPEVLKVTEVEKPIPKDKEVLIKVLATAVTAADTMMREGRPKFGRLFLGLTKPKHEIPGVGFAGRVVKIGSNTSRFKVGDKVFGESTENFGAYAEFIALNEDALITEMPAGLSFAEAATVCDGALTSLNFLTRVVETQPLQKILINGAAGSLGTSAVMLAKHLGAEVTGVCSAANSELLSSLGADKTIDYHVTDFTTTGETWDIIYDTVGKSSYTSCRQALTKQGTYISPVLSKRLLLQVLWTTITRSKKARFSATGLLPASVLLPMLENLKPLYQSGTLKCVIDKQYRIEDIAEAHRYVDTGHKRGNIVVVFDDAA